VRFPKRTAHAMIDKALDNQSMNHHDAATVSEELPNAELRQLRGMVAPCGEWQTMQHLLAS